MRAMALLAVVLLAGCASSVTYSARSDRGLQCIRQCGNARMQCKAQWRGWHGSKCDNQDFCDATCPDAYKVSD